MRKFSVSLVRIGPVGGDTPELHGTYTQTFSKSPFFVSWGSNTIISSKNSKSIFERSQGYSRPTFAMSLLKYVCVWENKIPS